VLADLACAIADGGEAVSDFRVICDQEELFGLVSSVPMAWHSGICSARHGNGRKPTGLMTVHSPAAERSPASSVVMSSGAASSNDQVTWESSAPFQYPANLTG
jgi:hypothetical protein